jgi:septum formation protein
MRLVLASASPRRAALLQQAGLSFESRPASVDESPEPGEGAVAHATRIARLKAVAATSAQPELLLTADTVVWIPPDGQPLGKPRDRDHAREMLLLLTAQNPHHVTTAWVLTQGSDHVEAHEETTRVWMRRPSDAELAAYLDTGQWRDKAGAYGIQEFAGAFVPRIEGSYTNVVGLPLCQVVERLQALGLR